MGKPVLISVICPVLNEEKFIKNVLDFFIAAEPEQKELLILDGGSTDNTINVIKPYTDRFDNIKLINNRNKFVPFALNKGISLCRGEIVIRIDAHCIYAPDYFQSILKTFEDSNADIVGGPTRIIAESDFQKAVAFAMTSKLGIGDSKVHDINYRGLTEHVTFGAWKKVIFSEIGFFDERLIRNQDDEFHYRANASGKKIFLNPDIKLWYHPRENLLKLFLQYFQYGLYKPLVLKKIHSAFRLRHIIPSLFVLYLITIPFLVESLVWFLPILIYILLLIFNVFKMKKQSVKIRLLLPFVFFVIHLGYGTGFIIGLFKK